MQKSQIPRSWGHSSCELAGVGVCSEPHSGPLGEQQVLLATEPSLQSQIYLFLIEYTHARAHTYAHMHIHTHYFITLFVETGSCPSDCPGIHCVGQAILRFTELCLALLPECWD